MAFATAVFLLPLLARGTLLGLSPPDDAPAAPPPQAISARAEGGGGGKAIFAKANDLTCAGHHCLPGGRERRAATIRSPAAPKPPAPLAPRRSRANHVPREASLLAMK